MKCTPFLNEATLAEGEHLFSSPHCPKLHGCSSLQFCHPGGQKGLQAQRGTQGKHLFCAQSGRILPGVLLNLSHPI